MVKGDCGGRGEIAEVVGRLRRSWGDCGGRGVIAEVMGRSVGGVRTCRAQEDLLVAPRLEVHHPFDGLWQSRQQVVGDLPMGHAGRSAPVARAPKASAKVMEGRGGGEVGGD